MADVTALGTAHEPCLPDREWWEVVVVEIALGRLQTERVQAHLLARGAKRRDAECLRLPAREQRRAVRARRHRDLDRDRTDLFGAASVRALLLDRDALADERLLELVERPLRIRPGLGVGRGLGVARVLRDHLLLDRLCRLLALELVFDLGRRLERRALRSLDLLVELGFDLRHVDVDLRLAGLLGQLALECAQLLDLVVSDIERVEDLRLGDLVRTRLDHQDRLVGAGDDQVEIGGLEQRLLVGVDDEVPVDLPDPHRADRRRERNMGDHQRRGGTVQREDVVRVDVVNRHRDRDELGLITPTLGEQWADRAIDQARGQRALLPRAALALEEGTGNLPGCIHTLLDIDCEGQEVHVAEVPRGGCTKDHRVARSDDDGAGGLLGQLAGLEGDLLTGDLDGDPRLGVRHIQFPFCLRPSVGGVLLVSL